MSWRSYRAGGKDNICYHVNNDYVVGLLAFVGGYVDAAGYLKLQGIFTSSITGNLVAASNAGYGGNGILCRAMVCLVFTLAGFLCALAVFHWTREKQMRHFVVNRLLFAEILFMFLTLVIGLSYNSAIDASTSLNDTPVALASCLMGISMGIHNVAAKEAIPNCPPTTVMTSTLINVAISASQAVCNTYVSRYLPLPDGGEEGEQASLVKKAEAAREKFITTTRPLIFFVLGAIVGAAFMYEMAFWSMVFPMLIIGFIITDAHLLYVAETPQEKSQDYQVVLECNSPIVKVVS